MIPVRFVWKSNASFDFGQGPENGNDFKIFTDFTSSGSSWWTQNTNQMSILRVSHRSYMFAVHSKVNHLKCSASRRVKRRAWICSDSDWNSQGLIALNWHLMLHFSEHVALQKDYSMSAIQLYCSSGNCNKLQWNW